MKQIKINNNYRSFLCLFQITSKLIQNKISKLYDGVNNSDVI